MWSDKIVNIKIADKLTGNALVNDLVELKERMKQMIDGMRKIRPQTRRLCPDLV